MILKNKFLLINTLILLISNIFPNSCLSQETINNKINQPINSETNLKVITNSFPPLVIIDQEKYTGFSIELWDAIASELNIDYTIKRKNNVQELIDGVMAGEADVAIAGISMTSEREKIIDFSHPIFESGLKILVSGKQASPFVVFLRSFFSPILWNTMGFLVIVTIICAHLMWFLERKKNSEMFPQKYFKGIWESFWWSIVTLVTVGYGDKTPITFGGRLLATLWMFTGILLISYFTASVSSDLTLHRIQANIHSYHDLRDKKVGTLANTTSANFLQMIGAEVITYNSIHKAYSALKNQEIRAIVYDAPVLMYYAKQDTKYNLQVVGHVFEPQDYAIVLQLNSIYRQPINEAILTLKENGTYNEIYQKWFGN
ncbi:transporter substrate-binding domain-containing protein [Cyanobacterium aponinum]|uniref:Amino acid ABC transporter substrate-binding protein, PAAT family n=1 Tax=Cyanobacterium aponinum (strain PCC 10605) TaxID=755178 RepID=K9Z7U9_CYAAP|nr:transporter substrate-binding domain-containing protein [Cyanobacterium aponinum]AFZ55261.1 amino acid ABC transporter substrate-binding protein, PAAT family [Cyanobacterium aponinum PCC 10605]